MRRVLTSLIKIYQKTLSPDHGWFAAQHLLGYCRFYPSCSEYTREAILAHGSGRGMWLGLKRLTRCHPWAQGGLDPIPPR